MSKEDQLSKQKFLGVEDFISQDVLDKVYEKFKNHIKSCETSVFFKEIVKKTITEDDQVKIQKSLDSHGLKIDGPALIQLLEANCYSVCIPKMYSDNHEWTHSERMFLSAFATFRHAAQTDPNYKLTRPEQQVQEFIDNNIGDEYINASSEWIIGELVDANRKFNNDKLQFEKDRKKHQKELKRAENSEKMPKNEENGEKVLPFAKKQ